MHKAQLILDSIHTSLSALITNDDIKHLMRSSVEPPRVYPAVAISMGSDDPITQPISFMDTRITIHTDIIVIANNEDLDREVLKVRAAVHKAIMLDQSQGLSFVINTNFLGQSEPEYKGDADTYAAFTRLSWGITYRTDIKDPTL